MDNEKFVLFHFNLLLKMHIEWNNNWVHDNSLTVILLMMTSKPQNSARRVFKIGFLRTHWWTISQPVMIVMDIFVLFYFHLFLIINAVAEVQDLSCDNTFKWLFPRVVSVYFVHCSGLYDVRRGVTFYFWQIFQVEVQVPGLHTLCSESPGSPEALERGT